MHTIPTAIRQDGMPARTPGTVFQTWGFRRGLVAKLNPDLDTVGINRVVENDLEPLTPGDSIPLLIVLVFAVDVRLANAPITDESARPCVEHNAAPDVLSGCHCDGCRSSQASVIDVGVDVDVEKFMEDGRGGKKGLPVAVVVVDVADDVNVDDIVDGGSWVVKVCNPLNLVLCAMELVF